MGVQFNLVDLELLRVGFWGVQVEPTQLQHHPLGENPASGCIVETMASSQDRGGVDNGSPALVAHMGAIHPVKEGNVPRKVPSSYIETVVVKAQMGQGVGGNTEATVQHTSGKSVCHLPAVTTGNHPNWSGGRRLTAC